MDAVIAWQMTKNNCVKHGFISFFGLKVLRNQLDLTDNQQKLNHQYRLNQQISAGFQKKTVQKQEKAATNEPAAPSKVNPIKVTYSFDPVIVHDFSDNSTAIVPITLHIQNLLQSECGFDVLVAAVNDYNELKNQGYVWLGKSSFILKNFKPNVSKPVLTLNRKHVAFVYELAFFKMEATI